MVSDFRRSFTWRVPGFATFSHSIVAALRNSETQVSGQDKPKYSSDGRRDGDDKLFAVASLDSRRNNLRGLIEFGTYSNKMCPGRFNHAWTETVCSGNRWVHERSLQRFLFPLGNWRISQLVCGADMILELTPEQAYILLTLVRNQIEFLQEYEDPKLLSIEIREREQCKQLFDRLIVLCG
jgi:hypothetical protein